MSRRLQPVDEPPGTMASRGAPQPSPTPPTAWRSPDVTSRSAAGHEGNPTAGTVASRAGSRPVRNAQARSARGTHTIISMAMGAWFRQSPSASSHGASSRLPRHRSNQVRMEAMSRDTRCDFDARLLSQIPVIRAIRAVGLRMLWRRDNLDDFVQGAPCRVCGRQAALRDGRTLDRWVAAIAGDLAPNRNARWLHPRPRCVRIGYSGCGCRDCLPPVLASDAPGALPGWAAMKTMAQGIRKWRLLWIYSRRRLRLETYPRSSRRYSTPRSAM